MGLKVLVLEAHVDDADCGCGATVYKHIKRGDEVQWHTFIGTGYRLPKGWPPDTLEIEQRNAMKLLRVNDYKLWDFEVDKLDINPLARDTAFAIWQDFDPDIAYVPWRGSRHQDHRALGDFVYQVSWRSHADVLAYSVFNDCSGFKPNVFSLLDDEAVLAKLNAISEFKSQFELRSWFNTDALAAFMESYSVFCGWRHHVC
jgi:LmbE family N-acetylglucosaminyl deacetylase